MWVTLSLVVGPIIVVALAAALSVSGHRKLDDVLKSLGACFKFD